MDARAALDILEGTGISMEHAAVVAAGRSAGVDAVRTERLVDGFLRAALRRNLSPRTVEFYENKLSAFAEVFEGRESAGITRREVAAWIDALPVSGTTKDGYLRALSVCFSWAGKQDPPMVRENPAKHISGFSRRRARDIDILTPEEARAVMGTAATYAPALALMLFAGVRPSEIRARHKPPLLWRQVDFAGRMIRISADQSKTRSARPLEGLPENLWSWLEAEGPRDPAAPICPGMPRQAVLRAREAIGRWSQDVCRHSFFTYHLAIFGDISRAMLIAGHEGLPSTMYQHYRGAATRAEATAFFGIRP